MLAPAIAVIFPAWALPDLVNNLQNPEIRERINGELEMAKGMLQRLGIAFGCFFLAQDTARYKRKIIYSCCYIA